MLVGRLQTGYIWFVNEDWHDPLPAVWALDELVRHRRTFHPQRAAERCQEPVIDNAASDRGHLSALVACDLVVHTLCIRYWRLRNLTFQTINKTTAATAATTTISVTLGTAISSALVS